MFGSFLLEPTYGGPGSTINKGPLPKTWILKVKILQCFTWMSPRFFMVCHGMRPLLWSGPEIRPKSQWFGGSGSILRLENFVFLADTQSTPCWQQNGGTGELEESESPPPKGSSSFEFHECSLGATNEGCWDKTIVSNGRFIMKFPPSPILNSMDKLNYSFFSRIYIVVFSCLTCPWGKFRQ